MQKPWTVAVVALCLLGACVGGSGPIRGMTPAAGRSARRTARIGLIVGHRLMDAGEYELALKAYLRAASEEGVNADVLSAIGSANLRSGGLARPNRSCAARWRWTRPSCPP